MYQEYVPLSRNIIGGEAVDMYEEFKHQLRNDVSGIEIIRTDFIRPSEQMSSDYSYKMKLLSEMWGASNMTDVAVLFKNGNNYFTTALKMACYNSNWYFFDNQSDLVDTSSKSCVWKTTLEEYKALCGEQQEQNDYAVSLGVDINHELQGELQAENLPVNYKISNQIASTSASEALNSVVLAMRKCHFPQKLIITLSVTIRYFPAIFEEIKHIHNAMKLRTIPFSEKIECFVVPFMMAASTTVEELSAAAVTRGIENPAPKTSITQLKFHLVDYLILFIEAGFTVAAFML